MVTNQCNLVTFLQFLPKVLTNLGVGKNEKPLILWHNRQSFVQYSQKQGLFLI